MIRAGSRGASSFHLGANGVELTLSDILPFHFLSSGEQMESTLLTPIDGFIPCKGRSWGYTWHPLFKISSNPHSCPSRHLVILCLAHSQIQSFRISVIFDSPLISRVTGSIVNQWRTRLPVSRSHKRKESMDGSALFAIMAL